MILDHGTLPDAPVDVLVPLGGVVSAERMDAARPKLIQQFGVGLQGVDMRAATERGIPVRNVPAADTGNAGAVAEIVIFHLLGLFRRFPAAQDSVASRHTGEPIGNTLAGKTVTVLGTGAIGAACSAWWTPSAPRASASAAKGAVTSFRPTATTLPRAWPRRSSARTRWSSASRSPRTPAA